MILLKERMRTFRGKNPAVFHLLLVMLAVYLIQILLRALGTGVSPVSVLGLSREDLVRNFAWYQPVTYLFVHAPSMPLHFFLNGLVIFILGRELESVLGLKRFLSLFLGCGAAGGLVHVLFSPIPVIGASAAVFALLLAYAVFWPDRRLYLFMVIPVRALVLVVFLAALEVLLAFRPSGISHFAHLGGFAAGGLYLLVFRRARVRERIEEYNRERHGKRKKRLLRRQQEDRERVDRLLDKISAEGMERLTGRERRFLDRASRHYGEHERSN